MYFKLNNSVFDLSIYFNLQTTLYRYITVLTLIASLLYYQFDLNRRKIQSVFESKWE